MFYLEEDGERGIITGLSWDEIMRFEAIETWGCPMYNMEIVFEAKKCLYSFAQRSLRYYVVI